MKKILLPVLILMLCLTGCREEIKTDKSDKVQIYTSFYAMEQFAKAVAGDRADIYTLVPSGGEAHGYEPTINDVESLMSADLFITNGNGMEHWSEDFIETVKSGNARVIEVSKGMPVVLDNADPHSWLSLDNALYAMDMIKTELKEIDESNSDFYEANFSECKKRADEIKESYKEIKGDSIVVTHPAYAYLCNDLNISQMSVEGIMGESDPTPADIIAAAEFMKEKNAGYIFAEKYGEDKIAKSIANEVGAEVLYLNSIERGDNGTDYFGAMEENFKNIKLSME